MKKLFENDCDHKMYLGSDVEADYYLYGGNDLGRSGIDNENNISICKRTGIDGEYRSIVYRYNPKLFIKTLTYIESMFTVEYCKKCGSKLDVDCGQAEPDYNNDFCSVKCYEQSNGEKQDD